MIPIDPCGTAMDMLRACYRTKVRFYRDSAQTANVRWYFCAPGAQPYPGRHLFGSALYAGPPGTPAWDYPGEVARQKFVFEKGSAPMPLPNGTPCGPPEVFEQGGKVAVNPGLERWDDGLAKCCRPGGPAPPVPVALVVLSGGPPVPSSSFAFTFDALEMPMSCWQTLLNSSGVTLFLISNDFVPSVNSKLIDLTEPTFPGYAPIPDQVWGFPLKTVHGWRLAGMTNTFVATGVLPFPTQTVYGWGLRSGPSLLLTYRLPTPATFHVPGDSLVVNPDVYDTNALVGGS